MNLKDKLGAAENRLPLPALARTLGMSICERPGPCLSPFREERKPSFSWRYNQDGRARWKDFGTGEGGDSAAFLGKALGLDNADAITRYLELAGISKDRDDLPLKPLPVLPTLSRKEPLEPIKLPNLPEDLHPGTIGEIAELRKLRDWDLSIEFLHEVSSLGYLRFGRWQGQRAWFLIDAAKRFFEARRMDGLNWYSGAKSDSRGTKFLLGAERINSESLVLLVEGAPDFLACSIYKHLGHKQSTCFAENAVPVAMLGAGVRLKEQDLERFKGARVIIFPHLDSAGRNARDNWKAQLVKAGARVADICLQNYVYKGGKDLADTIDPYPSMDLLWRIEARNTQLKDSSK